METQLWKHRTTKWRPKFETFEFETEQNKSFNKHQKKENLLSILVIMAIPSVFVLNLLTDIAKQEINADLCVTISESLRGAVKVGAATLVSSLVLGPAGFIVGSVGGGIWAYATSSDFKSLHSVLCDMTDEEKEKVVTLAKNVASERGMELALASLVTNSPEARDFLLEVMRRFGLAIKSGQ